MNLIINTDIRNKFMKGFPRLPSDVNQIVFHGTGGGQNASSLLNWMMTGERGDSYKKGIGLFHYLIDRDGTIYEIIDPKTSWVYHSTSGQHDKQTIGIEHMNPNGSNQADYTTEQYNAGIELVFDLLFPQFQIDSITGHGVIQKQYSGSYKVCPGPKFNWNIYSNKLTELGYLYNQELENIKDIRH